jgi:hypothetical protein
MAFEDKNYGYFFTLDRFIGIMAIDIISLHTTENRDEIESNTRPDPLVLFESYNDVYLIFQ